MELYLVQHGESKSEMEAPSRPLTDRAKEEVEKVACCVAEMGIEVVRILHSGKLRAKQTAELFAQQLTPLQGIAEQDGLGPLDDLHRVKELILQAEESLMIVGHLPHLKRLASLLILGEPEEDIVNFRMGGVVCLAKSGESWAVDWALAPFLARQAGQAGAGRKRD